MPPPIDIPKVPGKLTTRAEYLDVILPARKAFLAKHSGDFLYYKVWPTTDEAILLRLPGKKSKRRPSTSSSLPEQENFVLPNNKHSPDVSVVLQSKETRTWQPLSSPSSRRCQTSME
jgi:hypothetical protein